MEVRSLTLKNILDLSPVLCFKWICDPLLYRVGGEPADSSGLGLTGWMIDFFMSCSDFTCIFFMMHCFCNFLFSYILNLHHCRSSLTPLPPSRPPQPSSHPLSPPPSPSSSSLPWSFIHSLTLLHLAVLLLLLSPPRSLSQHSVDCEISFTIHAPPHCTCTDAPSVEDVQLFVSLFFFLTLTLNLFVQIPGRVAGWSPSTRQTTARLSWQQGSSMEMQRKIKVSGNDNLHLTGWIVCKTINIFKS